MKQPNPMQILDSLATAVLTFDDRLHLDWMNPAAEELFAIGLRQGQNRDFEGLFPDRTNLVQRAQEVLAQPRVVSEREVWLQCPGDSGRLVDITLSPLPLEGDRLGLLVEATLSDRRSRIAQEGRRIEEQRALRRVIRGLAHEVKNPLGGLRGAAQLLAAHLPDPDLTEYTEVIEHEVNRLLKLLDSLQGPRHTRHREPVNIHQVLERVRRLVSAEAPQEVSILQDYDPSLPEITADFDQLVQVFLNLAQNAVQAVSQQEEGRVILRTRVERNYTIEGNRHPLALRVEVADNGPGIPEAEQNQIFYPLVTSRAEGRGLGLSIAQDLITAHGGVIDLQSAPGHTVFQVTLPLTPPANGEANENGNRSL
ncbi:nitrogen regulation protein NR(II) [Thiohalorhabdus methylotrophus]|uniref:histidine kinase n=1 Tax=Thiohalorhabdus methylotrophus TaxID=3242694 RepID=A0ABV4TWT2_9GAMM